jgi:DNA helicase-2/ATP-dependent DNA helicase PcrA
MQASAMRLDDLAAVLGFEPTPEQWAVASMPLVPGVVVAGAGSGKTTSMAARVAWLVGSGLAAPDEVLGLTFTTKAAAQLLVSMRRNVAELTRGGVSEATAVADEEDGAATAGVGEPTVLTYNAFGARLLAEHGIRLGREPGAPVLTDGARQQLAYRVVCRSTLPLGILAASPATITADLLSLDDELGELAVEPEELAAFDDAQARALRGYDALQVVGRDLLATSEQRGILAALVRQWRDAKAGRDVIDFADQIRLAGELVATYPDIVADYRRRYRVVLLDEYQDTSISQRLLLQRLFGAGHPVLAVGDPCQAIYGWRGASVHNIDHFDEHFGAGSAPVDLRLTQCRRCAPNILEVANRVAEPLRARHPSVGRLEYGGQAADRGRVACALFETYDAELDWIVGEIGRTRSGAQGRGVAWRDIAVLAATGDDLRRVDAELRMRGIPTQLVGASPLLSQPAVIELRAMLEAVYDPAANPAIVRLLTGPRWRIGPRDLAALGRRASELTGGRGRGSNETLDEALDAAVAGVDPVELASLAEALDDLGDLTAYSPQAVERFGVLAAELAELRAHSDEPLSDFCWRVVHRTGIEVETALAPSPLAQQQRHALHAFIDLTTDFVEPEGRITLGAFLSRLVEIERLGAGLGLEESGPADAVQLLTVYKAKGLEFAYVFVPFMAKGAFPGGRARPNWLGSRSTVPWPLRQDADDDLAGYPPEGSSPRGIEDKAYRAVLRGLEELENRRLAYVAFTRAERGLVVTGHWWGRTQAKPRGPGEFLQTVHDACIDGFGEVVHWAPAPEPDTNNPLAERAATAVPWPRPLDPQRLEWRERSAAAVSEVAAVQPGLPGLHDMPGPDGDGPAQARIAEWDELTVALLAEAHARSAGVREVPLPTTVSATLLARALSAADDPQANAALAADLVRPMPRRPTPGARLGTAFHTWVEARYGQQSLLDPDDLPGAADDDIVSPERLAELQAAFESGPYADRAPVGVEVPFTTVVAGRVVAGRIDAVFADGAGFEVVDWKTGSAEHLDPMQLAVYRVAWSRLAGVPVGQVGAAFLVVGTGAVLRPDTDAAVAALTR